MRTVQYLFELMKWLKLTLENQGLRKLLVESQSEKEEWYNESKRLQKSLNEQISSVQQVQDDNQKLNKSLQDIKARLREQNEADLLLVSERIRSRILAGEKVKADDPQVVNQNLLWQQRAAQSPYYPGQINNPFNYGPSPLGPPF